MNFSRRAFFGGLAASLAALAIITTPGLLMPVKAFSHAIPYYLVEGFDYDGNHVVERIALKPAGGPFFRYPDGKSTLFRYVSSIIAL